MQDAVGSFAEAAERIALLKDEGADVSQLEAACQAGTLLLVKLREAQKMELLHTEAFKDATNALKSQLDLTSLQLHNLIYEKHHYQRETNANLAYESAVPDAALGLQPEEELLASLQAEQAAPLRTDPHKLMLWRLRSELQQRRALTEQLKELQAQKQAEADRLAVRKAQLDELAAQVRALDGAARPIANMLGGPPPPLRLSDVRRIDLLPLPLYLLHSQCAAAAQAHGLPLAVRVVGPLDAAAEAADAAPAAAGERDEVRPALDAVQLYQPHPLVVELDVGAPTEAAVGGGGGGDGDPPPRQQQQQLQLRFCYWPSVRLVGAWSPGSAEDDALLGSLFPGDGGGGEDCALLAQSAEPPYEFGTPRTPGRPYRWVQELAGADFVAALPAAPRALGDAQRASLAAGLQEYRQQRRVQAVVERLLAARGAPRSLTGAG